MCIFSIPTTQAFFYPSSITQVWIIPLPWDWSTTGTQATISTAIIFNTVHVSKFIYICFIGLYGLLTFFCMAYTSVSLAKQPAMCWQLGDRAELNAILQRAHIEHERKMKKIHNKIQLYALFISWSVMRLLEWHFQKASFFFLLHTTCPKLIRLVENVLDQVFFFKTPQPDEKRTGSAE